jgi:type I restriction enzyme M protein
MRGVYLWDKLPDCLLHSDDSLEDYPTGTLVEFEPDPDLRDSEPIPLLEEGGIEAFIEREVLA